MKLSELRSTKRIGFNWLIISLCRLLPPGRVKNGLYRMIGAKVFKNAWISPDVILDPVYPELITIQKDVFIGWGARIFTHMITPDGRIVKKRVLIRRGAFIGGFSTIRPGVVVGRNSVVGSDSLVMKSIPDNSKAFGIPAKIVERGNTKWMMKRRTSYW